MIMGIPITKTIWFVAMLGCMAIVFSNAGINNLVACVAVVIQAVSAVLVLLMPDGEVP